MADKFFIGAAFVPWVFLWSRVESFDAAPFVVSLFMTAAYLGQRFARWRFQRVIDAERARILEQGGDRG